MAFTSEQIDRYSRHLILKEVGVKGQKKLLNSKVLIIGAGGLGSPASMYLAAAGVGTIGIVDNDVVDLSNLQRQILHGTLDVGKPKTESARETIHRLNPDVTVKTYQTLASAENIMELIRDYDFILDGTDNFPSKYLINDACVLAGKPLSTSYEYCKNLPAHSCDASGQFPFSKYPYLPFVKSFALRQPIKYPPKQYGLALDRHDTV